LVEIALYFSVGFFTAALLAALVIPALSRRAMRLATARARILAPLSEAQARAERDMLRGQHALEIAGLQRKLAAAQWDRAVARVDQGRQVTRATKLDRLANSRVDDLDSQALKIVKLSESVEALQAEIGAREIALYEALRRADSASGALDGAQTRIGELETRVGHERTVNAALHSQLSVLEIEIADWRSRYGTTANGAVDPVADLHDRLQRSERAREAATLETSRQLKTLAEREAAHAQAATARDDLARRLAELEAQAKATETDLRRQVQTLSTSLAAAEGALSVQRAARHEREGGESRNRSVPAGDAELRAAIAELGRDVLRLRDPARGGERVGADVGAH